MITIGLDLSLVKSGIAIIKDNGTVLYSGLIKSKPSGDKPLHETKRIIKIVEDVFEKIDEILPKEDPDLVVIEGLAFMAKGTSLVQLSGLNYIARAILTELEWPFMIVQATTLKKFITQKGNAEKDLMMMAIFKDYGFESQDNNQGDAYGLSICGLAALGKSLKKLTIPQQEVVSLLQKQL